MTGRDLLRIAAVVILAAVLLSAAAAACPLCKDAKSDADYLGGTASLPSGFYYSILLMVSAPFAVVGSLLLRIHLARRRAPKLPKVSEASVGKGTPAGALVADPRGAQP